VAAAAGVSALAARLQWPALRPAFVAASAITLLLHDSAFLAAQGVPGLRDAEARYPLTAVWIDSHTPEGAVVLAHQHSGSIRHYAGRDTLRWDLTLPGDLVTVADALAARGLAVYAALEGTEESAFRARFAAALAGDADSGRPRIQLLPAGQVRDVRIWELVLSDRKP
jgi:hypothetical protein